MDYTAKMSSSISLNNQINSESAISNKSSSQQGVQYPNDNSSLPSSNHWQSNNISTIPTESTLIIDQNGDNIILEDIIKKYRGGLKIMNGRSYDQLTEKEQRDVYAYYANTMFDFIIKYAKKKYQNISDISDNVIFRAIIGRGGVIKFGPFSNKNIKDLNVKDMIQLSGENHIKTDDSFLKLEYRDFREVYMNKIKNYLKSNNF